MSKIYNSIKNIANCILAPIRVFNDKIYDYIYLQSTKNEIHRMYSTNVFTEYFTFFCKPHEIYPRIFLGSACNAASYKILKDHNIKFIINVSAEISNYYPKDFEYYQILIRDDNNESIHKYFDITYDVIENFINTKEGNILIHCFMGASRSATIVANYVSKKTGNNITQIIDDMKNKRNVVNPTYQYLNDLVKND